MGYLLLHSLGCSHNKRCMLAVCLHTQAAHTGCCVRATALSIAAVCWHVRPRCARAPTFYSEEDLQVFDWEQG